MKKKKKLAPGLPIILKLVGSGLGEGCGERGGGPEGRPQQTGKGGTLEKKKKSNHVLKKSFQEKGPKGRPHHSSAQREASSPGSRAFPAILIIHNEHFEKTLPTSKLTTISEIGAGFLFLFLQPTPFKQY